MGPSATMPPVVSVAIVSEAKEVVNLDSRLSRPCLTLLDAIPMPSVALSEPEERF